MIRWSFFARINERIHKGGRSYREPRGRYTYHPDMAKKVQTSVSVELQNLLLATLPFEYGICRSDQLEPFHVPGVWLTCPLIQEIYADDEGILKKERRGLKNAFRLKYVD